IYEYKSVLNIFVAVSCNDHVVQVLSFHAAANGHCIIVANGNGLSLGAAEVADNDGVILSFGDGDECTLLEIGQLPVNDQVAALIGSYHQTQRLFSVIFNGVSSWFARCWLLLVFVRMGVVAFIGGLGIGVNNFN